MNILKLEKSELFYIVLISVISLFSVFKFENFFQLIGFYGIVISLTIAAIEDFKEQMVNSIYLTSSLFFSFVFCINTIDLNHLLFSFETNLIKALLSIGILYIIVSFLGFIKNIKTMGEGDYIALFSVFMIIDAFLISWTFILMGILSYLYILLYKKERAPFIPFINLSFVIMFLLENV